MFKSKSKEGKEGQLYKNPKGLYRLFEMLPGIFAWTTIVGMGVAAWLIPGPTAVFIILFDVYWLLKTIYFNFYLMSGFREMKRTMRVNWLERIEKLKPRDNKTWEDYYHLLIFPMYKESYSVVKENLDSLTKTNYPLDKFIVVLSGEERAGDEAKKTIKKIENEFKDRFFKFYTTIHPGDIEGEIPGKGSNEAWAGKAVKRDIIDPLNIPYENIIVSVFDVDTQVYPQYFGRLMYAFLTAKDPLHSSYQPVPFFFNNIYEATLFARIAAFMTTFWNMSNQVQAEQMLTFSSHSMPFKALVEIGFWTTSHVSEDSLIFWQCFLHYDGNWQVIPLNYPVSMDSNVAESTWGTFKNIYKQQRRWGWGCENVPFVLMGFINNKRIALSKKIYWTWKHFDIYWGWATNALMILLLGRLPIWFGGKEFNDMVLSYNLPRFTGVLLNATIIFAITLIVISMSLLPPKPAGFKKKNYFFYVLQWLLLPINLVFFGSIPGLEAQTRLMLGGRFRLGFWVTPKARKGEELKE